MEQLPNAIEDIILGYKKGFEECEQRIHTALGTFLNIQASAFFVKDEIINVNGARDAYRAVENIIREAEFVITMILQEELTDKRIYRLRILQEALDHSMVQNVVLSSLEPFMDMHQYPPHHHHTESHIPPSLV